MAHPLRDYLLTLSDPAARAVARADALAALDDIDGDIHSFVRGNFTVTILAHPTRDGQAVVIWLRIVRTSNGNNVTPADLNPIRIYNPPTLVADPAGDIDIPTVDDQGATIHHYYREDLRAALREALIDILRQRLG